MEDKITSLLPPLSSQMAIQSILGTRECAPEVTTAISRGDLCESNHHPQQERKAPLRHSGLEAKRSLTAVSGGSLRAKFRSHDSFMLVEQPALGRPQGGSFLSDWIMWIIDQ